MSLRWHALLLGFCVTVACDTASGMDPFNTRSQVPAGPAAPVLSDADNPCRQNPLPAPLPLSAAIERSLCVSSIRSIKLDQRATVRTSTDIRPHLLEPLPK